MPVMVGNIADSPWEPLPALCTPCHPWQPLAALSRPWQLCQPSAATANPWPPLPALGNSWMGDAWGKGGECFNKQQGTIAICKGQACNLQKKKEKRFEILNRNCLKNSPLANCKRHPCNLQTTRLQFADGPLAICKRHAYILAIAPGEREAGVRVGEG